jgi:hypothetical protein
VSATLNGMTGTPLITRVRIPLRFPQLIHLCLSSCKALAYGITRALRAARSTCNPLRYLWAQTARAKATFLIHFALLRSPSGQALSIPCEIAGGSKRFAASRAVAHILVFALISLFLVAQMDGTHLEYGLYLTERFGSSGKSATFRGARATLSLHLAPELLRAFLLWRMGRF